MQRAGNSAPSASSSARMHASGMWCAGEHPAYEPHLIDSSSTAMHPGCCPSRASRAWATARGSDAPSRQQAARLTNSGSNRPALPAAPHSSAAGGGGDRDGLKGPASGVTCSCASAAPVPAWCCTSCCHSSSTSHRASLPATPWPFGDVPSNTMLTYSWGPPSPKHCLSKADGL